MQQHVDYSMLHEGVGLPAHAKVLRASHRQKYLDPSVMICA